MRRAMRRARRPSHKRLNTFKSMTEPMTEPMIEPMAEPMIETLTDPTLQQPLVSAIIIFFNAKRERFFEEAIESILAQTYDHWELLLADDGSTDESSAIAQQYVQKYPEKIRYLEHDNHQNRGMSATRNLGVRHAKGEYIAFLDADDVWLPHKLAQQVPLLQAHPEAAMLYGRTQFWFSWHKNNPVEYFSLRGETDADPMTVASIEFDRVIYPPDQFLLYLKDKDIYPCTCSMIIRRQVYEQLGGFEEQFKDANEDMVFHSKLFLKYPVYVSSQCWDRYRIHIDSFWRTAWQEGRGRQTVQSGRYNLLIWLEKYLAKQSIDNPQTRQLINKTLEQALFPFRHPILHRLQRYSNRLLKILIKPLNRIFNSFTRAA
jgi:glycosyltransferase involved in cell wall biosynthesis